MNSGWIRSQEYSKNGVLVVSCFYIFVCIILLVLSYFHIG